MGKTHEKLIMVECSGMMAVYCLLPTPQNMNINFVTAHLTAKIISPRGATISPGLWFLSVHEPGLTWNTYTQTSKNLWMSLEGLQFSYRKDPNRALSNNHTSEMILDQKHESVTVSAPEAAKQNQSESKGQVGGKNLRPPFFPKPCHPFRPLRSLATPCDPLGPWDYRLPLPPAPSSRWTSWVGRLAPSKRPGTAVMRSTGSWDHSGADRW